VPIVLKSGSLNLLELSGPVQACNGIALPFTNGKYENINYEFVEANGWFKNVKNKYIETNGKFENINHEFIDTISGSSVFVKNAVRPVGG
jgi:hypothetical protein